MLNAYCAIYACFRWWAYDDHQFSYDFVIFLVNPGAKERLVQITGPSEESINYAKLLIEDTIKRNASPIREASQEGSCSSLASSDDQQASTQTRARAVPMNQQHQNMSHVQMTNKLTRSNSNFLIHSLSSNDASLGEYKYTVNVGNHNLKITGDSLELVRVSFFQVLKSIQDFMTINFSRRLPNWSWTISLQTMSS